MKDTSCAFFNTLYSDNDLKCWDNIYNDPNSINEYIITEEERQNRAELFRLIKENPELPIIPMVDGEVTREPLGFWPGGWGKAQVDEYLFTNSGMIFKSWNDIQDALGRWLSKEDFENLPECEYIPYYDALPWKRAIIVYIVP